MSENVDLYSLMAEILKIKIRQDGWLHCAALLDLDEPAGELSRTEVATLKVKTKLPTVRIAKQIGSFASVLPVLIITMVLGSAVGRAQSVSVEDARCRALA